MPLTRACSSRFSTRAVYARQGPRPSFLADSGLTSVLAGNFKQAIGGIVATVQYRVLDPFAQGPGRCPRR